MLKSAIFALFGLFLAGCSPPPAQTELTEPHGVTDQAAYYDNTGRADAVSGGARMIPISTELGEFRVWTKRVGNNPDKKVLILHGGPGMNHEGYEAFDSFFPAAGIEYYYYDQLGSHFSDQPDDPGLLTIERYVEEVEQVRLALGLDSSNFYLFGHSWGGMLAMEYALKYQSNLKGLIISNMMASIPTYVKYAAEVLGPGLDPQVLTEIKALEAGGDFDNPRYAELINTHYYPKHVLRAPMQDWPEPVLRTLNNMNPEVYVPMQGPSEFGASGLLEFWDRSQDISKITVPTLVIGAEYDTMDPEHMRWMAEEIPNADYLYCPEGSHFAMYDDQQTFFAGLISFIKAVD
jgi:proline iminopeptidase